MAGIAGWIAPPRRAGDENLLGPMAAALAHRAQRGERLSGVVDCNERRQVVLGATLRDEASGISLVLDGGIVNAGELHAQLVKRGYRFSGPSAEEVLLRAYQDWDKDVVKQLRGAFAFAIWDARKDRLLLARDRFGEKPLYLHESNGAVYFASEPKALLKADVPCKVDLNALWDCLAYRYVPGPRTLFAGIRKLAPASYGVCQFGKLREVPYWIAPDRHPYSNNPRRAGDAVAGLVNALEESIRLQAAGGIFLSGGLDSGVLAALMSQAGAKSFSLGFEGDKRSELPLAAALARHFDMAHEQIVIASRDLLPSLPKLVACRDAPVSRPSDLAVHRLACEAARITKVVVTGDGCDEVFGGYRRYVAEINHFPTRLLAPLVSAGRFGGRHSISAFKPDAAQRKIEVDPRNSRLRRALYADQTSSLPDQLLERNDRATMAASVEARLPFLDHRVAEYVSSLPDEQRVRGFTTKWILRQAARRLLPAPLRRGPKAGWRLDAAAWLRDDLRDSTLEHLQSGSSVTRQYYDAPTLDRVLADHLEGRKNHETLLWTLLNIEIWHRTYAPG